MHFSRRLSESIGKALDKNPKEYSLFGNGIVNLFGIISKIFKPMKFSVFSKVR